MEPFSSLSIRRFEQLLDTVRHEDLSLPGIMPVVHSAGMAAIFDQRGDIEWAFALNAEPDAEPPELLKQFHSGFMDDDGQPREVWIIRSAYTNTSTVMGCQQTHNTLKGRYEARCADSRKALHVAMAALDKCVSEQVWERLEPLMSAVRDLASIIQAELECRDWLEAQEVELAALMGEHELDAGHIDWVTVRFEEEESHP